MKVYKRVVEKDDKVEDKKKKSSEKDEKGGDDQVKTVKQPKEKIIAGLEGMKPGAVMQAVSKSLGKNSATFLATHLIKILVNAAKNGKVKFDALKGAVKDFKEKNVEDNSNIDWEHVEIDPSGTTMKCFFDGDSKKIIDNFMKEYEGEMKDVKKEIDEADKKLHDDVKKAKIKIDDEKLDKNGLIVAGVIDDDKNKGKSGKELTKQVDQKIEQHEEAKKIIQQAKESQKKLSEIKVDPKIEKMSDEELSKAVEKADKKEGSSKDKESGRSMDNLRSKLRANVQKKIGKDYKNSVQAGLFKKDDFIDIFKKQNGFEHEWATKALKEDYIAAVRIDYYDDEAADVVQEKDEKAGYKVNPLKGTEKNEGLKKITDYIEKVMKSVLGEKDIGKIYKYRKRWAGDNPDGNFDQIYVFAPYKGEGLKESLNESLVMEANDVPKYLPVKTVEKITKWWSKNWTKTLTDNEKSILDKLKAMSTSGDSPFGKSSIFGDDNPFGGDPNASFGSFDYKKPGADIDAYNKLKDQWDKIRETKEHLMFNAHEYNTEVTEKGVKSVKRLVGFGGNKAFNDAIAYAQSHDEVAGNLEKISDAYANGVDTDELEKTGKAIKSAAKAIDASKDAAKGVGNAVDATGDDAKWTDPETYKKLHGQMWSKGIYSYQTLSRNLTDMDDMFDDGKIDANEMRRLVSMKTELSELQKWAIDNADSNDERIQTRIAGIKKLTAKYNRMIDANSVMLDDTTDPDGEAFKARMGIPKDQSGKLAATAENDEDAQKAAGGWKKALGLDKVFTAIGIARLAAKSTGIVLNHGKAVIDMAGAQAMKYKEDKDIIADFRITLTNGEGSKSKFEDTKFAVRFDVNDCKWHATCLDDRKMKFPQDKLIKVALDSEEGKKFKKYCLNRWKSIFAPEDGRRAIIPFILKNAEKLGLDKGKLSKEFVTNIRKMSDNFSKIESAMK